MALFNKEKASKRLKELREKSGWSQNDMGQKLSEIIGCDNANGKGIVLDGVNGKQTVSQLERGARGVTIDIAFAYAEVFDVSLDYVLGRSDDWHPSNRTVKEMTGLSDEAVQVLSETKGVRDSYTIDFCNRFIENELLWLNIASTINYMAKNKPMSIPSTIKNPLVDMIIAEPDEKMFYEAGMYYNCSRAFTNFLEDIVSKSRSADEGQKEDSETP